MSPLKSPMSVNSPPDNSSRNCLSSRTSVNDFFQAQVTKKEKKGNVSKLKSPYATKSNMPFDNLYGKTGLKIDVIKLHNTLRTPSPTKNDRASPLKGAAKQPV